jgi:hypothetical protein
MQTESSGNPKIRDVTCAQCGHVFGCSVNGDCWCETEPYRLPLPTDGSDCLCPDCLRKAAAQNSA